MVPRMVVQQLVLCACLSTILLGQQAPPPPGVREFPVVMEQSVAAGKVAIGTKIQAKLAVATLVKGVVIPRDALFSGEVVESTRKTATAPSRLAIRVDSVRWKNGSATLKAYVTPWYYPPKNETGQDLQYGPTKPANATWNGQGQYPDSSKTYKPFPGSDSDKDSAVPNTPSAATSNRRVRLKDVDASIGSDGTITLVSKHANLKLDKLTTYVLATGDLPPGK